MDWPWRSYDPPIGCQDWLARGLLFLSSYAILFGVLGVQFLGNWWPATIAFALCLAGFAILATMVRWAHHGSPDPYRIERVRDQGSDIAGYVVGYLLPLMVDDASPRKLFAVAIFIAVVGTIYVRSDLVSINPLLYVFGYRVLEVTTGAGERRFLIARHAPIAQTKVLANELLGSLLVRAKNDDSRRSEI